jgi:hypothetical protein
MRGLRVALSLDVVTHENGHECDGRLCIFQSQGRANRQGIDVFVEGPPGKALGVFDGVKVL